MKEIITNVHFLYTRYLSVGCRTVRGLTTEIMSPLHLCWVLAHYKHFHTLDEPPWPKNLEEKLPRLGDKCTEGHSTFWACSSFSTQAKGNPSLVLKLSQGLHHHSPSLQTLHSHPQTARKLCLSVCSWVTIYLSVVLLKTWNYSLFFPGFLLNLLEKKKKKRNKNMISYKLLLFSASRNSRGI